MSQKTNPTITELDLQVIIILRHIWLVRWPIVGGILAGILFAVGTAFYMESGIYHTTLAMTGNIRPGAAGIAKMNEFIASPSIASEVYRDLTSKSPKLGEAAREIGFTSQKFQQAFTNPSQVPMRFNEGNGIDYFTLDLNLPMKGLHPEFSGSLIETLNRLGLGYDRAKESTFRYLSEDFVATTKKQYESFVNEQDLGIQQYQAAYVVIRGQLMDLRQEVSALGGLKDIEQLRRNRTPVINRRDQLSRDDIDELSDEVLWGANRLAALGKVAEANKVREALIGVRTDFEKAKMRAAYYNLLIERVTMSLSSAVSEGLGNVNDAAYHFPTLRVASGKDVKSLNQAVRIFEARSPTRLPHLLIFGSLIGGLFGGLLATFFRFARQVLSARQTLPSQAL